MDAKRISIAVLLGVCLSLFPGCQSVPPPPPELTLDESAVPADLSQSDFWNGGALNDLGCSDARSADLTHETLSGGLDRLLLIDFDSRTKWPDPLPPGFDPESVMEANKDPGLGVRALHDRGITGKGVNLGIIDQNLLVDHEEYRDNVLYYRRFFEGHNTASRHGSAVTSIAVGRTVGVAPDANVYYVAKNEDAESILPYSEALNTLLDLNDSLPEEYKLDAVSISRGFNMTDAGWEEMRAALDRAEASGVFVITAALSLTHNMPVIGASRIPLSDYDDPDNTRPGLFYADDFYANPYFATDALFVPMDFRATASPTGPQDYANCTNGGHSWVVPYFAGVYCLAKQVDPNVTPQEFWSVAMDTASSVAFDHQGQTYTLYHVIDPGGIIDKLQAQ